MPYSISQILNIAKISEYLFVAKIQKGGLNGGGIDLTRPQKIYNIRKSIEYQYNLDPSTDGLEATANYLLSICDLAAAYVVTQSGTIASQSGSTSAPSPQIFQVATSGTFIIDGQSTKTITAFIGWNLLFSRGGIIQSTVVSEPSYFSWDKVSGTFICTPAAVDTELFAIYPV